MRQRSDKGEREETGRDRDERNVAQSEHGEISTDRERMKWLNEGRTKRDEQKREIVRAEARRERKIESVEERRSEGRNRESSKSKAIAAAVPTRPLIPRYPIPVSTSLNLPLSALPHLPAFPRLSPPPLWCRYHPRPPWHNHPPIQPTDQPYHTVTPRPTDQYLPTTKLLPDYHSIRPL